MSERMVDIGPVEQHALSTYSHLSLAFQGQRIRSDTRRYTQQDVAFRVLKIVSPTALAPSTLKSKHEPTSLLRTNKINHRLQKPPLPRGGAPHRAPPSVRTFTSAVNTLQTHAPSCLVVCRQHTQPTTTPPRNHTTNLPISTSYHESTTTNMSSNPNLPPTYVTFANAGSPGACAHCGPLQPPEPPRGPSARSVPHCAPTTPSWVELGHCHGPLPWSRPRDSVGPRGSPVNH
jgi:hypothetical protein